MAVSVAFLYHLLGQRRERLARATNEDERERLRVMIERTEAEIARREKEEV